MENKKNFGEYICQKRKDAGLTQRELAQQLFVTESAVSKWERGISYPDISLLKDICEILGVSEHELLTGSEDIQTRANEKIAQKYIRLVRRFKWAQIIIYGAAYLTCAIVNLAVQHTLSWSFIVLAALLTSASLTLLPIMVSKHRGLITLGGFTLSLLLLLFVCNVYTGGGWFVMAAVPILFGLSVLFLPYVLYNIALPAPWAGHKALLYMACNTLLLLALLAVGNWYTKGGWLLGQGLPLALFWLIIPWGFMLVIRYAKMNGFFKTAACSGILAAIFIVADGFTKMIIEGVPMRYGFAFNLADWSEHMWDGNIKFIILLALLGIAAVFGAAGLAVALRENKRMK